MRRRVVGYGLILLLLAASLSGVEFALRFLGLGEPLLSYQNASYRYAVRPDQHARRLGGAWVTIDSVGLRTTVDWTEPADARVLFVGDSVTWGGSSVDDRDLFSELVCVRLAERLGGTFNCGNAGTNAYGIENMTARLRYDRVVDDADVIVVVVVSDDPRRGLETLRALPFFSKPPARPFPAITELSAFAMDVLRHRLRFAGEQPSPFPDQRVEIARERLSELFAALRERRAQGKRIALAHAPERGEVTLGYDPYQRTLIDLLRGSGFEFVELRPHLQGEDLDRIYSDIVHLEPPGHRVYADVLGERIAAILEASPGSPRAARR